MTATEGSAQRKKKPLTPAFFTTIVLIIIGLILISTCYYVVDGTEQAVVTRFGKYLKTETPGLHFKLPFGIDRSYAVPITVVQEEQFGFQMTQSGKSFDSRQVLQESTMLTGDLNIVDVEWTIQYRIEDPYAYLFNVQNPISTIRDISRSVINTLVGDRAILDVIGPERTSIEEYAIDMMNETFHQFEIGINVIAVKLQNIVPPQGVQAAFEDVNKSIQDMNRLINEGIEAYNTEIPKAKGEAEKLVEQAKGYATERINMAQGDVSRFDAIYEEYRKAPSVTRQRLYLEMMETVFTGTEATTLIDSSINNVLPIKTLSPSKGAN